jgi:hypothetical protein
MNVAGRLMRDNQHACFNVQEKRQTCIAALAEGEAR